MSQQFSFSLGKLGLLSSLGAEYAPKWINEEQLGGGDWALEEVSSIQVPEEKVKVREMCAVECAHVCVC